MLILPPNDYDVKFSLTGYSDKIVQVSVSLGSPTTQDITLEIPAPPPENPLTGGSAWITWLIIIIVLAVVLGIIFFIYWKKKEDDEAMAMICPSCGRMKQPNMPACANCMGMAAAAAAQPEPEYEEAPLRPGDTKPMGGPAPSGAPPAGAKPGTRAAGPMQPGPGGPRPGGPGQPGPGLPKPGGPAPPGGPRPVGPMPPGAKGAPQKPQKKCKDCGAPAPMDTEWCDTCGSKLP
jgi:LPXTG-motif cell wall-anchored protein